LAARVLEEFETTAGAVQVVPGADGVFDVEVDGELVFTKAMLGRYPDPDDVMPLLRPHMNR
jgi:selT/selW/selH-like putative selenoprotein